MGWWISLELEENLPHSPKIGGLPRFRTLDNNHGWFLVGIIFPSLLVNVGNLTRDKLALEWISSNACQLRCGTSLGSLSKAGKRGKSKVKTGMHEVV